MKTFTRKKIDGNFKALSYLPSAVQASEVKLQSHYQPF